MGFCKRCGDIVNGDRCSKCGGTVVSAALRWNPGASSNTQASDSRNEWATSFERRFLPKAQADPPKPSTVVTRPLVSRTPAILSAFKDAASTPSTNAPRPNIVRSKAPVSDKATYAPSKAPVIPRTPSPLKNFANSYLNPDSPDPSIVLKPDAAGGNSLAKVYGSVLQPVSTIASFVCSACDTPFLPDATIYPNPDDPKVYFCSSCFSKNGGSRGACDACGQEVLRLKVEGGFVENDGRVWHTGCFKCEGCGRDISTRPMVDVLGRPCCEDCFDGCLKRGNKAASAKSSRNPSPASKAVRGRLGTPNSRADSSTGLASPGLKKSTSHGDDLAQANSVVEELAKRIGASPHRSPTREGTNLPSEAERPSPALVRSVASRLAALTADMSLSATRQARERDDDSNISQRFPAADFTAPPPALALPPLSHSSSSSSLQSSSSSRQTVNDGSNNTPTNTRREKVADNSRSSPRPNLNTAISGLLTPGSTPTQSPTRSPPSRTISITSPPATVSKIPSLRGRNSLSLASPPPKKDRGAPVGEIFSTPPRQPSTSSKPHTPSRIPSISSPHAKPTPPTSSPVINKGTSPAATRSFKGNRPSITIPNPVQESESDAKCEKCATQLFSMVNGRTKIVNVPPPPGDEGGVTQSYHADCFRCDACDGVFVDQEGAAGFVRFDGGVRHIECTPGDRLKTIKHASLDEIPPLRESIDAGRRKSVWDSPASSSSSIPRPGFGAHRRSSASIASLSTSANAGPATDTPVATPRFGSATACPGCRMTVSPMERGIVPGPGATKWHAACLVCGGRRNALSKRSSATWTGLDESVAKSPGCAKKLDSAAKGDLTEGVMWCRDCWDKTRAAGGGGNSVASPLLSPSVSSSSMGGIFPSSSSSSRSNGAAPVMGSTTMARQMTRGSGATSPLRRHLKLPAPSTGTIVEGDVLTEFDERDEVASITGRRPKSVAGQYPSGRSTSPFKFPGMGGGDRSVTPLVRPQSSGSGQFKSPSPVRRQYTGTTASGGDEAEPVAIQYTGGGVPVTRQLATRRPKSVVGMNRSVGSQKSIDAGRGMFLVRQMTGQSQAQVVSSVGDDG
ncbi:hypothetical protein FRB94_001553 [Tulasnella sp. JGI-2019a]|nr:hypothetical protein FRB94_001553 [Tulasnella sp. JGI-2019a]